MNKDLETIIENEFDCLIDDLGCLIGEEWKAKAIKNAVSKAFVLGGVSQQRELLLDYEIYNASEDDKKNNMKYLENLVDTYLSNNCG